MGDKSEVEKPDSTPLKSSDYGLGSDLNRRPMDADGGGTTGNDLDEVGTSSIFEFDWDNPREGTDHDKIPMTPDEKLRVIEDFIANCVTERLE